MVLVSTFSVGLAQTGQSTIPFYPLDKVQPGLQGEAHTVFEGTLVEPFDISILGVLKNVRPKHDLILGRLSGGRVERTGVFAGMSGSPVYIENQLVGAISYSFPFATEAIVGITPIRDMINIFQEGGAVSPLRASRQVNPQQIYEETLQAANQQPIHGVGVPVQSSLTGGRDLGRLVPIATPLNLSGFSPATIEHFAPRLNALGLLPVQGIGTAQGTGDLDSPLEPGSTVTVQLVRGDVDVSASGTATHISGDRVYAFGHPFMSIGYTDLPLNQGSVLTVIPNLQTSQKVSATGKLIGTIRQDRSTGILGITGTTPQLTPVNLSLRTSRNETKRFHFDVATDPFLTPFLVTFVVHNSIVSSERTVGPQSLQVKSTISVKDQEEIYFENRVSDLASGPAMAAIASAAPVNFLLSSGFEDLVIQGVDLELTVEEELQRATLEKIWTSRLDVEPGEEVQLTLFLRRENGKTWTEKYPIKIPEEIGPGPLEIRVSDGMTLSQTEVNSRPGEFVPKDLPQLIRAINNLRKNDRLYVRLTRKEPGAVVAGEGMPGLPPSMLALYNSEQTAGDVKLVQEVAYLEHELPATEFVLQGLKEIKINVK